MSANLDKIVGTVMVPGPTGTTTAASPVGMSQHSLLHEVGMGIVGLFGKSSSPNEMPPLTWSSAPDSAVFIAVHLSVAKPIGLLDMLPDLSMTSRMSTALLVAWIFDCPHPSAASSLAPSPCMP